jgi:membrane protein implicated in regulation of membrane protease activity
MKGRIVSMWIFVAISIILAISLVIVSLRYVEAKQQRDTLEETLETIQKDDIHAFIERARKVMAGEIIVEYGDDRLWRYSSREEFYPDMDRIESDIRVVYAHVNGDTAELRVVYHIDYFDTSGKKVRGAGGSPVTWFLEKRNEEWIIVDHNDRP